MIVQYVEFSEDYFTLKTLIIASSVSPVLCIVRASLRFYVVVIYNYHFKRVIMTGPRIALWKLVFIGNMTNSEMREIRYLSPFPL